MSAFILMVAAMSFLTGIFLGVKDGMRAAETVVISLLASLIMTGIAAIFAAVFVLIP